MRLIAVVVGLFFLIASPVVAATVSGLVATIHATLPGAGSNAFVQPQAGEIKAFAAAMRQLFATNAGAAASQFNALNYDVTTLIDTTNNHTYSVVQERGSGSRGLGTYIVDAAYTRNIILEVPHPIVDTKTDSEGAAMLTALGARALFIGGTSRCANRSVASPCDGTTGVCSGGVDQPFRQSDAGHFTQTFFQAAHTATLSLKATVFSLHGNSSAVPDVEISNGTKISAASTALVNRLRDAIATQAINVASCNLASDNPATLTLCGTTNVQGRVTNGSPDACGTSASSASGAFIHLEQHLNVRNEPAALIAAIAAILTRR